MCVKGADFVLFPTFFEWMFDLFRECGIYLFALSYIQHTGTNHHTFSMLTRARVAQ